MTLLETHSRESVRVAGQSRLVTQVTKSWGENVFCEKDALGWPVKKLITVSASKWSRLPIRPLVFRRTTRVALMLEGV